MNNKRNLLVPLFFVCISHFLFVQINPQNFLNTLAGKWKGDGKSMGMQVKDELEFVLTIDNKILHMRDSSVAGDHFVAEGYLLYNEKEKQFEFYEFNNGVWPVRILKGSNTDSCLVLEEKTADRHVRVTFIIKNKNLFVIEEAYVKETGLTPFVRETFTRKEKCLSSIKN